MVAITLSYKERRRNISIGVLLLLLGLLLPSILTVRTFHIYETIEGSLRSDDSGVLVIAAFFLVFLNSLRMLPIYVGMFLIGAGIVGKRNQWIFRILAPAIIWLEYQLVAMIYDVTYDFGFPSFIVIAFIYLLDALSLYNITIMQSGVVLIFALIGAQFLDVIPALSPLGFGRGVVSTDIKAVASVIDRYDVLTISAIAIMAIFLGIALLIILLLLDQHKLLIATHKLGEAQIRSLEDRRNSEIRSLMHDLKTPLTTIQGLAGVISIIAPDDKIREYSDHIIQSGDVINGMVAQILDDNKADVIELDELFNFFKFQIISGEMRRIIEFSEPSPCSVSVNKILFSRAIINLINNAYDAVDPVAGRIEVGATAQDGWVQIAVQDNGPGIKPEILNHIWAVGYSGRGSTGLGLNFVKSVVESSGGYILLESHPGSGTLATIRIKEVTEEKSPI